MSAELWSQLIGWFSLPVLAVLAGVLILRKIPQKFPYFFTYVIAGVLLGLVRLWVYYSKPRAYAYLYWTSEILGAVLVFLATYELLAKRLFPRFYNVRLYQYLFPVAAALITLFAVPAILEAHKLSILLRTIHVFNVLRVTMLLFLVGLMAFMGRQWTRYELGIAMGLVVEASALLAMSAVWVQKPFIRQLLTQLPPISYDISSAIWLFTFWKPEKPTVALTDPMSPEIIGEAQKWEKTLKRSWSGKKPSK